MTCDMLTLNFLLKQWRHMNTNSKAIYTLIALISVPPGLLLSLVNKDGTSLEKYNKGLKRELIFDHHSMQF